MNYTQPWKAELSFYPQSRVYEYACHEGNYGIVGMLKGARLRDAAQAAAAAKAKPVSAPAKAPGKATKTQ